jgi:N-methylhydantoinase A
MTPHSTHAHVSMPATAGVDVGGTFTDVVAVVDEAVRAGKVPTTTEDQGEGVAEGLAAVAPGTHVGRLGHGTTTATNAVLERDVARTVLITTRGFADLLTIARQNRPSLYDLRVTRPSHLVAPGDVVTVDQRSAPDGSVVVALADAEIARVVEAVTRLEPGAIAVCLLFSYAAPDDERRLCAALESTMAVPVTRSSALVPEFREYERASTCVLNAAVAPVMRRYLSRLSDRLRDTAITVMTSGGGTAALDVVAEAPVHTLLSGPAAGVVAAAATARSAGFDDAVAFDMGGTSTDVCLIRDGRPDIASEAEIGGLPFRTPAVAIHTVGAGGGSLAWVDAGGALRVGPRSAGARPGPACYGQGGTEATVTDAHCVAGHLAAGTAFGSGALRLDVDAARDALAAIPALGGSVDDLAQGILTVARATMARALRRVTTERGVDPRGLALIAYGGAGPLHASALAAELGCAAVIVPPAPGVLSALGLLLAPSRAEASQTVMRRLDAEAVAEHDRELDGIWRELESRAEATLLAQRVRAPELHRVADCRYAGQSHELRIDAPPGTDLLVSFHDVHRDAYGYAMPAEPVDVVTMRVTAEGPPALAELPTRWDLGSSDVAAPGSRRVLHAEGWLDTPVLDRRGLTSGEEVAGPAVIEQPDATTLLAPGDVGSVDEAGNLVIRRVLP